MIYFPKYKIFIRHYLNILKNKLFEDLQLPDPRYNFGKEDTGWLTSNLDQNHQDTLPIFRKHSRVYLQTENVRHVGNWMYL
jgi:hypothetical protein